jgi:hypothetical protein
VHPATGRYSKYSDVQAASLIQKVVRMVLVSFPSFALLLAMVILSLQLRLIAPGATPKEVIGNLQRTLRFEFTASSAFKQDNAKLSNVINWALVSHVMHRKYDSARDAYKMAMDLAPTSPLVGRAYAVYLIDVCEAPRERSLERASDLLQQCEARDPTVSTFAKAFTCIFKGAALRQPQDPLVLTSLAVVYAYVYRDYNSAERLMR